MFRTIAAILIISYSKIMASNDPKIMACNKVSVVFESKYNNTRVKVYADDSLWFDKRISNKNYRIIEVADAIVINRPAYIFIEIGNKRKKIKTNDNACYIYVKRKGLFRKIVIEQLTIQRKFR